MKMLDFAIGKKLPLDVLMQPVFLEATRGWGKTSCAKALYEAGHAAGAQCIAIVPTGKWWSLRLAGDGKSPGLVDVFIFGGPHGDVPLTPESGALVAKLLVDKRIHAVIDVSLMRKGQRARFLAELFEEFWLLKKLENDSYPVVFFIEEAHAVAPQKPQPDEARMLGAMEDIASEGRNHGIGVVFLDQRAARVNKNVLALVEVLIVGRVIHPLDLKANGDWVIDKGSEDRLWLKELPSLESGEAYIYAPVLGIFERVRIRMPHTFNATATAKIGERVVKAGALTQVDITGLRESMSQVIAEAEKNDPRALQREIARLKSELAKKPTVTLSPAPAKVVEHVEVSVLKGEDLKRLEAAIEKADKVYQHLLEATEPLQNALEQIGGTLLKKLNAGPLKVAAPSAPKNGHDKAIAELKKLPAQPMFVERHVPEGAAGLSKKGLEMVRELVALHPREVSRAELAARTLLRVNRNFRGYLKELRDAGLIEDSHGGDLIATAAAHKMMGEVRPKTSAALLSEWHGLLSGKSRTMVDWLFSERDTVRTREEMATHAGLGVNRNFRGYLREMRTAGLIEADGKGFVAGHALFLGE